VLHADRVGAQTTNPIVPEPAFIPARNRHISKQNCTEMRFSRRVPGLIQESSSILAKTVRATEPRYSPSFNCENLTGKMHLAVVNGNAEKSRKPSRHFF